MSNQTYAPPCKRIYKDRIVYTFVLEPMPSETTPKERRRSALVIVWHDPAKDGAMMTHFLPDIGILQGENGEIKDE